MAAIRIFFCGVVASTLCLASSASIYENTSDISKHGNDSLSGSVFIPKFMCPAIYGSFPHPTDCTRYYECRFGLAYELTCSKNKYFDEVKSVCREKSKVDCDKGEGIEESTEAPTEPPPKDFKCPWFWGTYADPVDCSRFYVCAYKIATSFRCGPLLLFDEKKKRCRLSILVDCGSRLNREQMTSTAEPSTSTETTEVVTTTEEPFKEGKIRFFCPFRHGKYADPNDCAQYYECRFFLKFPRRCPKSKLYDERKEECVDASKARCGSRPGGSGNEGKDPKPEVIKCPYIWGTFPHPTDCSKYVMCLYNVPTVITCRKYELFNVFSRRCAGKRDVKCQKRINPDDEDDATDTTSISTTTTENMTPSTITTTEEPPTTTAETIPITDSITTTTSPPPTTEPPITEPPTTEPPTTSVEPTRMTNIPPPNDCEEDDVECIVDETGDTDKWFNCPERYGQFPHLGSKQLFVYCDNWRPSIKRCASGTVFSLTYHVCTAWDYDE